jgi:hypothetical protein
MYENLFCTLDTERKSPVLDPPLPPRPGLESGEVGEEAMVKIARRYRTKGGARKIHGISHGVMESHRIWDWDIS